MFSATCGLLSLLPPALCGLAYASPAATSPAPPPAQGRTGPWKASEAPDLLLKEYWPRSMLRLPVTEVRRARFPVIDMHQHVNSHDPSFEPHIPPQEVIAIMDETNVKTAVILTAGWGDELQGIIDKMVKPYPGRFVAFTELDWKRVDEPDFGEAMAAQIRDSVARGARGLKFIKSFGLRTRYRSGKLVELDDPRVDPVWRECAKLGIPVALHSADPDAFFMPLDPSNERYEELKKWARWHHWGGDFPTKKALFEARERLFTRHPRTMFIALHVAMHVEDLDEVGALLKRHPNVTVELGAQQAELGRQPRRTRKFFIDHQDRVMFGTDVGPMTREAYRSYFRWLETADEHFDYYNVHNQGRWRIYGLDLPAGVLDKIYRRNAERLLARFKGPPRQSRP